MSFVSVPNLDTGEEIVGGNDVYGKEPTTGTIGLVDNDKKAGPIKQSADGALTHDQRVFEILQLIARQLEMVNLQLQTITDIDMEGAEK